MRFEDVPFAGNSNYLFVDNVSFGEFGNITGVVSRKSNQCVGNFLCIGFVGVFVMFIVGMFVMYIVGVFIMCIIRFC